MGKLKKNTKNIFTVLFFVIILLFAVYNIFLSNAKKNLSVYMYTPVKNISTVSTRTSFVTDEGVFLTGNYYHDLDTSIGLNGFQKLAYEKINGPVMIFDGYADNVLLTNFGGFITQKSNLFIFTNEDSDICTPTLIVNDCLEPVNAFYFGEKGYCVLYVNDSNELILKSLHQNSTQLCLENVLKCKYYSNGVYLILKTDGTLLKIDSKEIVKTNDSSKYIKIAENIQSFDYSPLSFGGQGEQENFVLLSKDNKVYKKQGLNASFEEICSNSKDIGIHQQKIIVLTLDGELIYFSNGAKTEMKAKNVETISVSDDIVCAYSKTDGLLFWGINKYNSFGCNTTSSQISLNSEPARQSRDG